MIVKTIQPDIVDGGLDEGLPSLTVMKEGDEVTLWSEDADGEAMVAMTRDQFEAFVAATRKFMGWDN